MFPQKGETWIDKRDGREIKITSASKFVINGKEGPDFVKMFSCAFDTFMRFYKKK